MNMMFFPEFSQRAFVSRTEAFAQAD